MRTLKYLHENFEIFTWELWNIITCCGWREARRSRPCRWWPPRYWCTLGGRGLINNYSFVWARPEPAPLWYLYSHWPWLKSIGRGLGSLPHSSSHFSLLMIFISAFCWRFSAILKLVLNDSSLWSTALVKPQPTTVPSFQSEALGVRDWHKDIVIGGQAQKEYIMASLYFYDRSFPCEEPPMP